MIGLSKELEQDLAARGYSEADVLRLFGPHAHRGELRVIYERPNGDRTSGLPSSRHMAYVARGWRAVALVDDPPPAPRREPVTLSEQLADYAKADRRALYRNGDREAIYSTRQHADLSAKGWEFVRLTSPREEYIGTRQGRTLSREETALAAGLEHATESEPAGARAAKK